MQAIDTLFSPAGPIQATEALGWSSLLSIVSVVEKVFIPQIPDASLSSALPLIILRYTGVAEAPLIITASYPANFK